MLKSLYIKNIVLIDEIEIEFKDGLCVLTGETGAGKSIILDSLGLVLGNRASLSMKPKNNESANVTAVFSDCNNLYIDNLLKENEIDYEEDIILKRIISKEGKSKSFINDQLVSLNTLKKIGENLVEIESQFSEQGLLDSTTHLTVLDQFGGYNEVLDEVRVNWNSFKLLENEYLDFKKKSQMSKEQQDDVSFQIMELKKLSPQVNEYEDLRKKKEVLSNSEKIKIAVTKILKNLSNEDSLDLESLINSSLIETEKISQFIPDISKKIVQSFDSFLIDLNEFKSNLSDILDYESNKFGIEEIDERIYQYNKLSKRFNCNHNELPAKITYFQNLLHNIRNDDSELGKKKDQKLIAEKKYFESANVLSEKRKQSASAMDIMVNKELPDLKLENGFFKTNLKSSEVVGSLGIDNVKFLIRTNPKSDLDEIKKISSGGELCRFALAIKVVSSIKQIKTVIFDEVDSGIGGSVASAVGERLSRLGKKKQIIVVTHSPQVAAIGDQHLKVTKSLISGNNITKLFSLDSNEKINEIARMLSGKVITPEAQLAAKRLIESK
tara:strand:- start:6642 stop:8300 length:1659 start_codon:yes stop_codon:yes gene_type:complete